MPLVLLLEYCWLLRKGEGKKNKGEKDKHLQTVLVLKLVSRASLVPKKSDFVATDLLLMMKSGQEQRTQLILLLRASSQDFHIEFVKSLTDMKNS